jgi:hypothetical protein
VSQKVQPQLMQFESSTVKKDLNVNIFEMCNYFFDVALKAQ